MSGTSQNASQRSDFGLLRSSQKPRMGIATRIATPASGSEAGIGSPCQSNQVSQYSLFTS